MVNENLIAAKLFDLTDRIQRARSHCPRSAQELSSDLDALDLVAFNLMLAVQICADIAAHIITDEGWPAAKTLAASFDQLAGHGVTTPDIAEQLKRGIELRNLIAHGYTGINVALVHAAGSRGVTELDAFARDVARFVSARRELPQG